MTFLKLTATLALSSALALGAGAAQAASVLYGITGAGGASSDLYTVDEATGAATLVGSTGVLGFSSIDFDPLTGTLYGMTGAQAATQSLYTIDTATGSASLVANLSGIQDATPDMTFTSDGTLYSWNEPGADDLITIDTATGAATTIVTSLNTYQTGLAADSNDTLYVKVENDMYTIDANTGATTFLGTLANVASLSNVLAIDAFDNAFSYDRGVGFYALDFGTLNATFIGDSGVNFSALAFSVDPAPVPLPATGLLLIAGFGLLGATRRRKQS